MEKLKIIAGSTWWNEGLEGVFVNKINKTKMNPELKHKIAQFTKWTLRVTTAGAIIGETVACATGNKAPEPQASNNTNTQEYNPTGAPLVLPTSTERVYGLGDHEFITQREIETKLKGPFDRFKSDQEVKNLFKDPSTIQYSASGVKVYDAGGQPTAFTFFSAVSETEEKGKTFMVFGEQGGVTYLPLNRIITHEGNVGLGITQDLEGNELEKSVLIFDTGLSESEVASMTNEELEARDILFIPGGILISPNEMFNAKMASLIPPESQLPPEVQYEQSADGTVLWTAEGMANGELRVRDEKAKELRNDTLRALWAVNNALVNPAEADTPEDIIKYHKDFTDQFRTADALIKYVEDGGAPIDIYIPVNSKSLSFRYSQSNMTQKVKDVDLSAIVVNFDILPEAQLTSDYKSEAEIKRETESPYVEFDGISGEYLTEVIQFNNRNILKWSFRREMAISLEQVTPYGQLAIYEEQAPEKKLLAISQLVKISLSAIADLKPEYTGINTAFEPHEVFMDYKKLFFSINNPDPVLGRNPNYRNDDYIEASNPSNSYFELKQ